MPKPASEHKPQPTAINLLAKKAKYIHQHKNINEQLYKTNQSVWFNKMFRTFNNTVLTPRQQTILINFDV
jgi:tRNA G37 N-methylase Trm5